VLLLKRISLIVEMNQSYCWNESVLLPEDGPSRTETCRSNTMLRKWC